MNQHVLKFRFSGRAAVIFAGVGIWLTGIGEVQAQVVCPTPTGGGVPGVPTAASAGTPGVATNASVGGFANLLALDSFVQQIQRNEQQQRAKQRAEFVRRQQAFREFMIQRMKQAELQQRTREIAKAKPVNPRSRNAKIVARLKQKKEDRLKRLAEYRAKRKRGRRAIKVDEQQK